MAGGMRVQLQGLLDDKEKQLNLAGTLGQRILAQQLELEERVNQIVDADERLQTTPSDADEEMRVKLEELADVMQSWETENQGLFSGFGTKLGNGTTVMPPSPMLPSMNEFGMRSGSEEPSTSMRSSGPSAVQSSRRAKNAAHRANDVEFAFEIGSSLLVEVRRLQALLAERDKALQDMKEEKDDLEKRAESLEMSLREQENSTEKFKEENWNLEVQLQEVRNALNDTQATIVRLESEQKRTIKQLAATRETSDALKTENDRLTASLEELRAKHETDTATMRKNTASLQREKSDLQAALDALKADMAKRERAAIRFGSPMTPGAIPRTPAEEDDVFSTGGASRRYDASGIYSSGRPEGEALRDFDSSPEASPSKPPVVGPTHPSNELESTKQSLAHAHRQISTLKSAVQREKELNRDMKKRLADHLRSNSVGAEWADEDPDESVDVVFDEPGHRSLPRLTPARARGRGRGVGPRRGVHVSSLAQRFNLASHPSARRRSFGAEEVDDSIVSVSDRSEILPTEDLTSPFNDSTVSSRPPSVDGMDPAFANVLRHSEVGHDSIASASTFGSRRARGGAPRVVSRPSSIAGALAGELAGEGFSIGGEEPGASISASLQQDLGLVSPVTSPTRSTYAVSVQDEVDEVEMHESGVQTEPVEEIVREVPVEVIREVPVEVIKEIEVVKEVPTEVIREVIKEVPVEVIKEVPVEVIKEVEVVREIEVVKEVPVDVVKEVQVERVKEIPVEVVKEIEVVREVPKEVIKEVPVEVIREVEVIKEVPVEVVKEIPIEVIKPEPKPETAEQFTQTDLIEPLPLPIRSTSDSGVQSQPSTSNVGVVAAAGINDASIQTRAALTANTEVQADEELSTPVAVSAPSPRDNGFTMLTPPRSRLAAMADAMDITPTPNATRAGAQQGLAPAPTFLESRDSLFQGGDDDAQTITATETPTEGEWVDAQESVPPTPAATSEIYSSASGVGFGFQSAVPQRVFDTKSVDAVPASVPKPELRDTAIQTDTPTSLTPVGFQRLGAPSQFKYIPSSPIPAQTSELSAVAMGKRPLPAPQPFDTFGRAGADRRQSTESAMSDASSMRSTASPKPKPVGPIVQVDRTRPPTMMLPPPPPMPPPPMPAPSLMRRTMSNVPPARPNSPPPSDLIQRATTPTLGSSSLVVPQRTYGTRQPNAPSPPGGLRQPPSTGSFRSGFNPNARQAQGPAVASVSRRPSVSSSRGSSEQHRARFAVAPGTQRQPGGATDPAIIQAITQTMIGEFLFKYTRKVVGKGHGEKRHKRFFWIHPYTKTLYWSDADPGANGVVESSAKSAYIDSVRAVLDPNPVPPGIHQYSIVVSTPQREMKFTAPTRERHDIWFNALNYLLARPSTVALNTEPANQMNYSTTPPGPAEDIRQQIMASPRSAHTSESTGHNDGWGSNSTPKAYRAQSQVSSVGSAGKRHGTPAAEYMRWNGMPESPTKPTQGYQQQMIGDETGYETMDQDDDGFVPIDADPGFEGLENVRACCDGAHDLGSLSRNGGARHHHHHHNRPPSRAQDAERPLSPAFSFHSRASSRSHGDRASMFSWRGGDGEEKKYSLRFGSKRSKSKRPTSPAPSERR